MNSAILVVLQILAFLAQHKDAIKQAILDIEALIPDAPGSTKAAALRGFIGAAMGIEAQIEAAWPFVSPIFNLFVGDVKSPAKSAA